MKMRRWLTIGLLAVALAAAGCSSSSSGSPSSPGSGSSATGTGTAVKIGLICECSGAFGTTISAGGQAAQAWAKAVNASGGISGHPVELTVDDDASNPGTSVTEAHSLIAAHVSAILDLTTFDSAWQKAADAAGVPVIGGNLNSSQFYQDPNWYPAGGTNDSSVAAIVAMAKQAGKSTMGLLYCAEAPQCSEIVAPAKQLASKVGISVPYAAAISGTAPNYTAQCIAAKQAHITALFVSETSAVFAHVVQDCTQQNYNPTYLEIGTGFGPSLASSVGKQTSIWLTFAILPFFANQAPVEQMNTAMDKYYPGVRTNANAWTGFAAQAWVAGQLIGQAIKATGVSASGAVTAAAMTKALNSISNETLDGWTPPLTFTPGKPHPVDCWYTARIQNGITAIADNGKTTCENGSA